MMPDNAHTTLRDDAALVALPPSVVVNRAAGRTLPTTQAWMVGDLANILRTLAGMCNEMNRDDNEYRRGYLSALAAVSLAIGVDDAMMGR